MIMILFQQNKKSPTTAGVKKEEDFHFLFMALCQILLMGHFRRRPVLAPGAAFFQLPFPFDAIGSGR